MFAKLVLIKRYGGRSLANHNEVLLLCRRLWHGEVVEHTGAGTFEEQMELFYSAAVVVGQHGAGFSNAIAMRPGSTLLEVLPETASGSNRLNVCYAILAFTLGISSNYQQVLCGNCEVVKGWPVLKLANQGCGS